ncbi:hypothetical protein BCR44DRAFT_1425088 [Catenaria anguillulae PL171]|uniref:Cilia- and flagella-associated protein 69 ARM repeats domain-containing protein n=1 Tax=Catenaria anguillulae PL171 TaxID=765915 RepID=A0A1Y2I3A1_9FUNG|nr:hypothetical protein BCR44DRAFT_1425088 [Catenaria anguillulae PL171]
MVQMIPWTCAHPRQQELMRVAVLDAIWAVVCGCRLNEESLLEAGGTVERSVVGHLLAVLVELLENPKTRQHMAMWSSSRFKCAGELLVGLWRRERSQIAFEKGVSAVEELRTNHCCKIFSILSHLGFNTFRQQLNAADQRLLLQIEGYLDLKIGIVWDEIKYELNSEGIQATETKRQLITSMQSDVERRVKEAQAAAEHGFFSEFMRAHHMAAVAANAEPQQARRWRGGGGSAVQLMAGGGAGGKRHSVAFATLPELITTPRPPSSASKASLERLASLSADGLAFGGRNSVPAQERPQRPLRSPKARLGT